jgi:peptide/nickel transport system permease protein
MQRINYILVRLLQLLPVALGITIILFFVVRLIPGDPALIRLGIRATPESIENFRRQMGLDKPIMVQYFIFMAKLFRFDLGNSLIYATPVINLISERLPRTIVLAIYATTLSILITVPMALLSAFKKDKPVDQVIRFSFVVALGMPQFWIGTVLLMIFSVRLGIFPVSGFGETWQQTLRHLFLPAMTLAMAQSSWLVRSLRSDIINVMSSDYVDFARAKGLKERIVNIRHILRNSLLPTVTILGLNFGKLLGGSVVVEKIFSLPGMGNLMIDSIFARDYVVIQAITFIFAVIVILVNLITDLLYSVLDPRVTLG